MRGLDLRRDGEIDVQPSLVPQVDVLDVRRTDHCGRSGRLHPGERARDEIDLVPRGAGDEEVGLARPGLLDRLPARSVRLDRAQVEAIRERLEPLPRRAITVRSCSAWSASTMVEPTWPAPTSTIFTPRGSVPRRSSSQAADMCSVPLRHEALGLGRRGVRGGARGGRGSRRARRRRRRACVRAGSEPAPRPFVRGLDMPVFVTQAPGEPGRLYVVEQNGLDPRRRGRQDPRDAVPRRPLADRRRRRAGTARARVPAATTRSHGIVLRQLHGDGHTARP